MVYIFYNNEQKKPPYYKWPSGVISVFAWGGQKFWSAYMTKKKIINHFSR